MCKICWCGRIRTSTDWPDLSPLSDTYDTSFLFAVKRLDLGAGVICLDIPYELGLLGAGFGFDLPLGDLHFLAEGLPGSWLWPWPGLATGLPGTKAANGGVGAGSRAGTSLVARLAPKVICSDIKK